MIAVAVAAATALVTWSFSNAFVSPAARECTRRYAAARTPADSAGVDSIVPAGTYQTTEPRSCGSFRGAARWIAHP
jgi:hypothetical protein